MSSSTRAISPDPTDDARRDLDPVIEHGIAPTSFRLSAEISLGQVVLQVADLARSLDYYTNVLGLAVIDRSATVATLGTSDGATPLVELRERKGARTSPQHARLGLYHFAILLPDRPALGRFVAHLGEIGARVGASDHLVSEAIYLRDPDGLGIEVYADRPRSSWRAVDRQLQMASEPLDLESVIRAAGGARWDGMPPRTTMGHVHLHVGDLDEAARFYHDALGFDKMVWAYQGALFLAAGGYHHHLGLNIWTGAHAPRPTDEDARLIEWRIETPAPEDARAAADSLRAAGFDVTADDPTWLATDPWSTSLRLLARA